MENAPSHGQIRRACAAVLQGEPGLTSRQIAARLKRQGLMAVAGRDVEQELLAAPAVFRHDTSESSRWSVDPLWREALSEEPTLLRYLVLQNWKVFESASLTFRDMTLLFGENSAGKSSVIQALLMLKQTFGHGDLQFEGAFGSFGDLANVVHRHSPSAEMKLIAGWEMQLEAGVVFVGLTAETLDAVDQDGSSGRIRTIFYTPMLLGDLPDGAPSTSGDVTPAHKTVSLTRTFFEDPDEDPDDDLTGPAWLLGEDLPIEEDSPSLPRLILQEDAQGWPGFEVVTTQMRVDQHLLTATVRANGPSVAPEQVANSLPDEATARMTEFASLMVGMANDFEASLDHFGSILDSVIHIGPSRTVPDRWQAIEVLPSDHYLRRMLTPELIFAVNGWLERFEIPFEVSMETRHEQEGRLLGRLAVQHVDGGERVQLQDIGFGVSQLLPIIVQAVANQEKTILIEEPEAHVHPRLQSVLGDLFVESTQLRGNAIVAETHSEPLLLRLQRRIAEGALLPHRLAVFNVVREGDTAKAEPVGIDESGRLDYQWPGGFFDNRMDDLVAILDPSAGH